MPEHCFDVYDHTIYLQAFMLPISDGNVPVIWLFARLKKSANASTFPLLGLLSCQKVVTSTRPCNLLTDSHGTNLRRQRS